MGFGFFLFALRVVLCIGGCGKTVCTNSLVLECPYFGSKLGRLR
jgi:hypothetical protein